MSSTITSAAQTSTNAIPNLHGGAHPATPRLAGIICGSCVGLAWTICFIYWWWHRAEEKQARAEMEAARRSKEKEFRAKYPPGSKILSDRRVSVTSRPRSSADKPRPDTNGRPISPTSEVGRAGSPSSGIRQPGSPTRARSPPGRRAGHGHVQEYTATHVPLTPMAEVTTKEEAGPQPPPKS